MLLTLEINQILFIATLSGGTWRETLGGGGGAKPGLQTRFQLSHLIYSGFGTSNQLLGRLNDIHQLSGGGAQDEAFHSDCNNGSFAR